MRDCYRGLLLSVFLTCFIIIFLRSESALSAATQFSVADNQCQTFVLNTSQLILAVSDQGDRQRLLSVFRDSVKDYLAGRVDASLRLLTVTELLARLPSTDVTAAQRGQLLDALGAVRSCISGATPQPADVTVYGNATDPGLIRIDSLGESIEFFGTKDVNGLASSVTGVTASLPNQGEATIIFDADGHPTLLQAGDVTVRLQWLSETDLLIDATNGQQTVTSFPVTFPLDTIASSLAPFSTFLNSEVSASSASTVTINVTACGQPVDFAKVGVQVGSTLPVGYLATSIGGGAYVTNIPVLDANAGANAQQKCEAVGLKLSSSACSATAARRTTGVCAIIGGALIAADVVVPGSAIVGAAVLEACPTIRQVMLDACVLGLSATAAGCPMLASVVDRAVTTATVSLTPTVVLGARTITGNTATGLPSTGPFPPLTVDASVGDCTPFVGNYDGSLFTAHTIADSYWDHSYVVEPSAVVTNQGTGTFTFKINLTSFPLVNPPAVNQSSITCSVPVSIKDAQYSGSAPCGGWIQSVSGTLSLNGATGTWRLVSNIPDYDEDTGAIAFTLNRKIQ